jgi:hypothetical protein
VTLFQPQPSKSTAELFLIAIQRDMFRIELAKFMERYPIICPPFCVTAFGHEALEVDIDGEKCSLFETNWPAIWVNCAGLTAAVVPRRNRPRRSANRGPSCRASI